MILTRKNNHCWVFSIAKSLKGFSSLSKDGFNDENREPMYLPMVTCSGEGLSYLSSMAIEASWCTAGRTFILTLATGDQNMTDVWMSVIVQNDTVGLGFDQSL